MRISHNFSRTQGSASHNDRMFDLNKAPHIEQEKLHENLYWCVYDGMAFEEAEKLYYKEHYSDMMREQNKNRVEKMDVEDYLRSPRYCPEELILQIGSVRDSLDDPELFDQCFHEYMEHLKSWNAEHGDHVHILDYAIHKDEATVHAHVRRVFDYTDPKGRLRIGTEEALRQAGVTLPKREEPEGRYNSRKLAFDTLMRKKWTEICQERGIEVDRQPEPQPHKHIRDYKRDMELMEIAFAEKQISDIQSICDKAEFREGKTDHEEQGDLVSIPAEKYIELLRSAQEMEEKKKSSAEKSEEAKRISDNLASVMEERGRTEERNKELKSETEEIKSYINEADPALMVDVMNEGNKAFRERTSETEQFLGYGKEPYNRDNFYCVEDAMDAMENFELQKEGLEQER